MRQLELTRYVSLRQLDPLALLALKTTHSCTTSIPSGCTATVPRNRETLLP